MCGAFFHCQDSTGRGGGGDWHQMGGDRGRCSPADKDDTAPSTKNYLAPNGNRAQVEKLWPRLVGQGRNGQEPREVPWWRHAACFVPQVC